MSDQNTPWYDQSINQFDVVLIDKKGKEILTMLNNDRMKFILKAVNNHVILVDLLESTVSFMRRGYFENTLSKRDINLFDNAADFLSELKEESE